MRKIEVSTGIYWVEVPEADLRILCGCPADSVKHMMKKGLIVCHEKNGVTYESGPNAILLSDISVQHERFCNLAEFPVLQMLYRQGMLLPNHPGNTGEKPILIGLPDQLKAQAEYIFRGNYGLSSVEEIMETGISEETAHEMMRIKLMFAFGEIKSTHELLDLRPVLDDRVEIRNGAFIKRISLNEYEISYGDDSVSVDLNLGAHEEYIAPYQLGYHEITRQYFSVIHSGDGDGWDVTRPCMSSIITFQGKIYLIDAGPNLYYNLSCLGISVSDIEGIFHTHCHDDHFNGLTVLLRSARKIKYYATPLVRSSVEKKLSALVSLKPEMFSRYFEVHDLEFDKWNNINGLEVKPVYSPHPVDTSVMFFRALWEHGYKTYAHLADIPAFDVMAKFTNEDKGKPGIYSSRVKTVKKTLLEKVDIKKLDCGGGMIHGKPEDFAGDRSDIIILSHSALPFTIEQKEIGSTASFGMEEPLITSSQDYTKPSAFKHLKEYFPQVPDYEIRMLLNFPVEKFNPGSILVKRGEKTPCVYFILSGLIEFIISDIHVANRLSSGSIAGEVSGILNIESRGTYRAISNVSCLKIPSSVYKSFLERNNFIDHIMSIIDTRRFMQKTWLFGEMLPCPLKSRIAQSSRIFEAEPGIVEINEENPMLYLIVDGNVSLEVNGKNLETLSSGDFFGEEYILYGIDTGFRATCQKNTTLFEVPAATISEIPIVQWKLLEIFEKRVRRSGAFSLNGGS